MYIGYDDEQEALRRELRAYYEELLTPEVRESLVGTNGRPQLSFGSRSVDDRGMSPVSSGGTTNGLIAIASAKWLSASFGFPSAKVTIASQKRATAPT